jgi:hypothetical protein
MTTHDLKCWPEPFNAVAGGRKTFEWRRDDRGYAEGDTLHLREWNPDAGAYTGRTFTVRVGYVLRGPEFDVPAGWAVLSLREIPKPPKPTRKKRPKISRTAAVPFKPIREKTAQRWIRTVPGGLPTLGKRK